MKYVLNKKDKKQRTDYKVLIFLISGFCSLLPGFCCLMAVIWLLVPEAHGALIYSLDERRVLEVPISQEGLTRIKVEDDRILHVFGLSGEYVLETDEDQGQIFIRPLN